MKDYYHDIKADDKFLDDMETIGEMSDAELDRLMADPQAMADNQLLAGYAEAAAKANGQKPHNAEAWQRMKGHISRDAQQPKTFSKTFWWLAAAVMFMAVGIVATMKMTVNVKDKDESSYSEHAYIPRYTKDGHLVVSKAIANNSEAVAISDNDGEARQVSKPVNEDGAIINSDEANFCNVTTDDDDVTMKTVTIPRGKLYKVVLSDGSQVWLNTDSRLTFPERFVGQERVVTLHGEAYFKVAKDAKRPFIVLAGNIETRVLGTEFNFRCYDDMPPEVALLTGSVIVGDRINKKSVRLVPGQAATIRTGNFKVNKIDPEYYRQKRDGVFYFDQAPLLDVLREIGRWYNVDIEMAGSGLDSYNVHFVASHTDKLDDIIDDLNFFSYLNVRKKGNKLIISKK